ncbi:6,7-dimethyl-8-ribityllumazine synthase [Neisseria sp. Ec49-e6-T10]|uniref:6,7-dimethyl-8-ribityllumazine synthase n=1 Tax=Neisseria sp. Ec49-e6-T10 TaxID=3140744 RepID=UPI003EBBB631
MNHIYNSHLDGSTLKIGIVQSCFSREICDQLLLSCTKKLQLLGVKQENIHIAFVPGALEIPVALQAMTKTKKFDALVALGVVIRGETYHFELVSNESGAGVSRVALDSGIPIANAILTTENEAQALVRMNIKAEEAAVVAVQMAHLLKDIEKE